MASISSPEQAFVQLSELLRNRKNKNDKGFLYRVGKAVLDATRRLESLVEITGLAQKGKVKLEISMHAFRNGTGEIVCKPTVTIGTTLPSEYAGAHGEFYVGDEGALNTSPVARQQEKMFTPEIIEGGASENVEPKKGRKAE